MILPAVDTPLRVLMVLHLPWGRNLGAPRVQLELAEAFRSRGHVVEKFSYTDAFEDWPRTQLHAVLRQTFAARAREYVARVADQFDVIEAQQGDLPYAKEDLGFEGLLVVRSSGLYELYEEFRRYERRRWPARTRGKLAGRAMRRWQSRGEARRQSRSLECADLINALNDEERTLISDDLGLGEKCVVIPNGLAHERFVHFEAAAHPPERRLATPLVAFVGYWSSRKGSHDWGSIVRGVRAKMPQAEFAFLGTGRDEATVFRDLALEPNNGVRVLPSFSSEELPALLGRATVGALPSYVEGFPLAVLEKLAAGLPTVAYDVPGPRETLRALDEGLLTRPGDTEAFAARVVGLLRMSPPDYAALVSRCRAIAQRYSWRALAERTLEIYSDRLQTVRGTE